VTISYSVKGGYLALEYKFLGDDLVAILKDPKGAIRSRPGSGNSGDQGTSTAPRECIRRPWQSSRKAWSRVPRMQPSLRAGPCL